MWRCLRQWHLLVLLLPQHQAARQAPIHQLQLGESRRLLQRWRLLVLMYSQVRQMQRQRRSLCWSTARQLRLKLCLSNRLQLPLVLVLVLVL